MRIICKGRAPPRLACAGASPTQLITQNQIDIDYLSVRYPDMADLEQLLTRIGWKQRQFAAHIEVDEDTVSRWKRGKRKTPKVVLLYLELLAEQMRV